MPSAMNVEYLVVHDGVLLGVRRILRSRNRTRSRCYRSCRITALRRCSSLVWRGRCAFWRRALHLSSTSRNEQRTNNQCRNDFPIHDKPPSAPNVFPKQLRLNMARHAMFRRHRLLWLGRKMSGVECIPCHRSSSSHGALSHLSPNVTKRHVRDGEQSTYAAGCVTITQSNDGGLLDATCRDLDALCRRGAGFVR
jgi:hypothetical protein